MYSIISTVGTTVFGKFGSPLNDAVKEFERSNPGQIEKIVTGKTFPGEAIYDQALADLRAKSGEFLRRACAEINAIEGVHQEKGISQGNEYHFLASQTATGVLAARVLADFCKVHYNASSTSVKVIQGLQVQDAKVFRLTGLPYLIQTVYQCLDEARSKHLTTIINPTGGFKAAIPYLTLVGMLRQSQGVQVSCIHESSTELITLAGMPVSLDLIMIQKIHDVLERCDQEQEDGLSTAELATGLGLSRNEPIESHSLWALFERYDHDHYILSGLGSIALEEIRMRLKDQPVWLSFNALERLDKDFKAGSEARRNFETILNRIHDPANRVEPYRHPYKGSEFPAYKYKGNERLFYYEHPDGYILILELAQHVSDNDWSYDRIPGTLGEYTPYRQWHRSNS